MKKSEYDLTQLIARVEKLEKAVFGGGSKKIEITKGKKSNEVDFSPNIRAFVKRYVADKSGPKKFTLLIAYLAKGEIDNEVELSEIRGHWNKMSAKSLLGKFNRFYANEAKTQGWVDSKKHGAYCLTKEWRNVL